MVLFLNHKAEPATPFMKILQMLPSVLEIKFVWSCLPPSPTSAFRLWSLCAALTAHCVQTQVLSILGSRLGCYSRGPSLGACPLPPQHPLPCVRCDFLQKTSRLGECSCSRLLLFPLLPAAQQLSQFIAPSGLNTRLSSGIPASWRQTQCGSCSFISTWQQSLAHGSSQ